MYHSRSAQRTGYLGKLPASSALEAARGGVVVNQEEKLDSTGAYAFKPLLEKGHKTPPEEFSNPPGTSRGECDSVEGAQQDADCDLEVTAQVQDFVLEETKPGFGIEGFEGEEVGGG
jgi:hypothetical protein